MHWFLTLATSGLTVVSALSIASFTGESSEDKKNKMTAALRGGTPAQSYNIKDYPRTTSRHSDTAIKAVWDAHEGVRPPEDA